MVREDGQQQVHVLCGGSAAGDTRFFFVIVYSDAYCASAGRLLVA